MGVPRVRALARADRGAARGDALPSGCCRWPRCSRPGRSVRQLTSGSAAARPLLRHDAGHDALTGLPNRTHFDALLDGGAWVAGVPVAIAFIDLDDFKRVNDSLGHGAGDALLARGRASGSATGRRTRPLIARFGGDEFLALIRGEAADAEARRAIQRLRATVLWPVSARGHGQGQPGASSQARPGEDAEDRAPATRTPLPMRPSALGRDPHLHSSTRRARPRSASACGSSTTSPGRCTTTSCRVAYQPIVSWATARSTAVEALARWTHPDGGRSRPTSSSPSRRRRG